MGGGGASNRFFFYWTIYKEGIQFSFTQKVPRSPKETIHKQSPNQKKQRHEQIPSHSLHKSLKNPYATQVRKGLKVLSSCLLLKVPIL